MDDKQTGGLWIPEVAYVDKPRPGTMFIIVRWLGERILRFGAWLKSLSYYQVEIHPQASLRRIMEEMKINGR